MIEERGSENSIMEYKKREMKLSKQHYLTFSLQWNSQTHLLKKVVMLDNRSTIIHVHITFAKFSFLVLTKFLDNTRSGTRHYKILRRLEPNCLLNSPGGGTPENSWWGCAARFSKSWAYFRPKRVIFHCLFQTRPLKSIPVFRPGRSYHTRIQTKTAQKKHTHTPFGATHTNKATIREYFPGLNSKFKNIPLTTSDNKTESTLRDDHQHRIQVIFTKQIPVNSFKVVSTLHDNWPIQETP